MEYKKDKRIENLTLRDIHVGDWVQVWSEKTERYSPPLKIIQICDDGTIYLVTNDEERATPWEENIKNVDVLPITPELLKGFGFEVMPNLCSTNESFILYNGVKICVLMEYSDVCYILMPCYTCGYFHDFIQVVYDKFPEVLNLEWKGLE